MARFFDIIIALQRNSIALENALFYLLRVVKPPATPPEIFAPAR